MKKFLQSLLNLGISDELNAYTSKQVNVFNAFNLFGGLASFTRLLYIIVSPVAYTNFTILVNCLPLLLCVAMGLCMYFRHMTVAALISFICFPPVLFLIYAATLDYSVAMFLILYFIFPFFFLTRTIHIVGSFIITATCFLLVNLGDDLNLLFYAHRSYKFDLGLASINFVLAIVFIFTCLLSIRNMVISYQRNLTKKKKELMQLNAVKDKIFSIVSHDLRSPMAATAQLLDLIKTANLNKEDIDFYLGELKVTVDNTRNMMDNLLNWSKSQMENETVHIEELNVSSVVTESLKYISRQAEGKEISLVNYVNDALIVSADKEMVTIILRNLISNAIKFTPVNGVVSINTCKTLDGKLSIQVRDNGVGIPLDKQECILGKDYYTTSGTINEQGSGLGLKICQDLAIKNQGKLSFESFVGSGTIFSLTLPLIKHEKISRSYNPSIGSLRYA